MLLHGFDKTINGTTIDDRICNRVMNLIDFQREVEYICDEYVLSTDRTTALVALPDLCVLLCRVSRGLSLGRGNISILGLPKCGKKVLVELCTYLIHGKIYRISDNYD